MPHVLRHDTIWDDDGSERIGSMYFDSCYLEKVIVQGLPLARYYMLDPAPDSVIAVRLAQSFFKASNPDTITALKLSDSVYVGYVSSRHQDSVNHMRALVLGGADSLYIITITATYGEATQPFNDRLISSLRITERVPSAKITTSKYPLWLRDVTAADDTYVQEAIGQIPAFSCSTLRNILANITLKASCPADRYERILKNVTAYVRLRCK